MTTTHHGAWRPISMGSERALARVATDGTTFLFGRGPAGLGGTRPGRLEALARRLAPAVSGLVWCRQVHGVRLQVVDAATEDGEPVAACDGLLTAASGVGLAVWTADCVPVLAAGRRLVAAVHAGWRGAAAGIIPVLLERCRSVFGEEPAALQVFLGPAICSRHYPVGPEVIAALDGHGVDRAAWHRGDRVDLRGFLRAQLLDLGVVRVDVVGGCTAATPTLASFRRDGEAAGRQVSVVYRPRRAVT